ncbi:MAG: OmpA family protein [Steroidobacter sp.]
MARNRKAVWLVGATLGLLHGLAGVALGAQQGTDHPMFSRYPGSEIIAHRQQQFARTQFATGFPNKSKPAEPTQKTFEGKTTTLIYQLTGPQSALEVLRNYEQALGRAGLKTLLSCFNQTCGNQLGIALFRDNDKEPLYRTMRYDSINTETADFGYVSATGTANGAPLSASVFVGRIRTGDSVYVGLDIVEGEAMKTDQIVVDLNKLTQDIREQGKVVLSGIYFDTDKDIVKPESEQALQAILQYLQKNPQQNFFVVGHSDTAGSYEHNVDLSRRRAQAVVTSLIGKYAAAKPRLTPVGIGPVSPAGTNANDAGRARNRRVELVLR